MSMPIQREIIDKGIDEELVEVVEKFNMLNVVVKDLGKALNVFINKVREQLFSLTQEIEMLKNELKGEEEKVEKEETTM